MPAAQPGTATVGAAVPTVHTSYDSNTGRPTATSTTEGSVTSTISRVYDSIGRQTSYQDADGNVSTAGYDLLDRLATMNDGKGAQTFTYDTSIEPRGLPTSMQPANLKTATRELIDALRRHTDLLLEHADADMTEASAALARALVHYEAASAAHHDAPRLLRVRGRARSGKAGPAGCVAGQGW